MMVAYSMMTLAVLTFLSHWYMMVFAKKRLGSLRQDQSYDFLYSQWRSRFVFVGLFMWQSLLLIQLCSALTAQWPESYAHIFPHFLIDVLGAGAFTPTLLLSICGFFIYSCGYILRFWSIQTLGNFFTFEIGIREGHQVLEAGPYRIIRHPSYTGYLLMLVGMGFVFGSWFFLVISVCSSLGFFFFRIPAEEKMLAQHFGDSYRTYQKRTKRLIPYLI